MAARPRADPLRSSVALLWLLCLLFVLNVAFTAAEDIGSEEECAFAAPTGGSDCAANPRPHGAAEVSEGMIDMVGGVGHDCLLTDNRAKLTNGEEIGSERAEVKEPKSIHSFNSAHEEFAALITTQYDTHFRLQRKRQAIQQEASAGINRAVRESDKTSQTSDNKSDETINKSSDDALWALREGRMYVVWPPQQPPQFHEYFSGGRCVTPLRDSSSGETTGVRPCTRNEMFARIPTLRVVLEGERAVREIDGSRLLRSHRLGVDEAQPSGVEAQPMKNDKNDNRERSSGAANAAINDQQVRAGDVDEPNRIPQISASDESQWQTHESHWPTAQQPMLHWAQYTLPSIGDGYDIDENVVSGVAFCQAVRSPAADKVDEDANSAMNSVNNVTLRIVNRLPSAVEMNRKDTFGTAVRRMAKRFGRASWDFHPDTWAINDAEDRADLTRAALQGPNDRWIAKDSFGGQGKNVFLFANSSSLLEALDGRFYCESNASDSNVDQRVGNDDCRYVVQRYIGRPLILQRQGNSKHTLRIYLLISSVAPLRVWLHTEGVAKFASTPYSNAPSFDDTEKLMHVTNNALNARTVGYIDPDDTADATQSGSRWSINGWRREIDRLHAEQSSNAKSPIPTSAQIWNRIVDGVVKSAIAMYPRMLHGVRENNEALRTCNMHTRRNITMRRFQFFGSDVEMDADYKPWIIEHNVNPMLNSHGAFERPDKLELLRGLFDIVGVANFDTDRFKKEHIKPLVEKWMPLCGMTIAQMATVIGSERALDVLVDHEFELIAASHTNYTLVFPSNNQQQQEIYSGIIADDTSSSEDQLLWGWHDCRHRVLT